MLISIVGYKLYRKIFPDYNGWKKIEITNIGSFYVPEDWIYAKKGTMIYFTDKPITEEKYKVYLIGTEFIGRTNMTDIYPQYKEIKYENYKILSNGAYYGKTIFESNNEKKEKFHITLSYDSNRLHLYAWDNLVDIETIKKISESYIADID